MEAIGGKIGKFISLEENSEQKVDERCVKILIKVDLQDGLYEEILLELHGSSWKQRLDYWKISFRCFSCRQVDHVVIYCLNNSYNNTINQVRNKKVWVKKAVQDGEEVQNHVKEQKCGDHGASLP